jgi:putative tryptophan/tyrosine transport system substrate-binding protein
MHRREVLIVLGTTAAAWPLRARAQSAAEKSYRLGYLALLPGEDATYLKLFSQRLRELGYSEAKNVTIEYRSAEGRPERLGQLAAELMQGKPDVLVAGFGTVAAKAAAAASKTVPVVFTNVGDPVGAGLVASLARPGANVTGLSAQAADIAAKRLQMLRSLLAANQTIAVLLNPDTPFSASALAQLKSAAQQAQQGLVVFEARNAEQISAAIDAASSSGAAGLMVLEDPVLLGNRQNITDRVAAARLPAAYGLKEFAEGGGLLSYGQDLRQNPRRAADYVDRILKGTPPADLPVEQPTKFELVINLIAAKALGLTVPPTLLGTADEVIE